MRIVEATVFSIWAAVAVPLFAEPTVSPALVKAEGAQSRPAEADWVKESLASQVQHILEISGRQEWLPSFEKAISSWKDEKTRDEAIEKLVSALNAGTAPCQLSLAIMAACDIKPGGALLVASHTWKYGSKSDRFEFVRFLWATAQALDDPEKAAKYSRAALLIGADLEFEGDTTTINSIVAADPLLFTRVAALSPKQSQLLAELRQSRKKELNQFYQNTDIIAKLETAALKTSGPQSPESLSKALDAAKLAYPLAIDRPSRQWHLVMNLWDLKNLATGRSDTAGKAKIVALLQELQHNTNDRDFNRWISQAIQNDGPMPPPLYFEH